MSIKFTTLLGIAACALASSSAFAQPESSRGAVLVAQNGMSNGNARDKTMIQKQTNPRKNGASESESVNGANTNGQPQK